MRLSVTAALTDLGPAPALLAAAAEERAFAALYVPEHTHLPLREESPPALVDGVRLEDYRRSLDPFVSLAAAATATTRLGLGTGVALVAQRDPIVLAKEVATLDWLSGGRVTLGIGYGWNRAEAADHGVEFATRRALLREKVLCMKALWSTHPSEFHGELVDLPPSWSYPKPTQQPHPRLLLGGAPSQANFRAVAELADGWMPIGGGGIAAALPLLHAACEEAGRDPTTVEVVPFGTIPTPAKLEHLAGLGVSEVVLRLASGSSDEMLRGLDELAAFVDQ
jgi:probable F420-dependent oxidoreductase